MCLSESSFKFAGLSQGADATSRLDAFVMKTLGLPGVHKATLRIYVYTYMVIMYVHNEMYIDTYTTYNLGPCSTLQP